MVTEAFWHYRPVARSAWRTEYKLGAFYPALSMENKGPLWTSPYTLTSSVINSWIAEEIRTLGGEARWQWRDPQRRSPHQLGLTAGVFMGNDPAGAILAWRGWANSDRQTGIGERLPLADLPNLRPARALAAQDDVYEPFVEIDNRPGFYLGADWHYQRQFKLALHYYDNQADPSAFKDGQYAWKTEFWQAGFSWKPGKRWELFGQYMDGSTKMNNKFDAVLVDNDFNAFFVALSYRLSHHRLTYRWEQFTVDDNDMTVMDSNNEFGHSATLSYAYYVGKQWKLGVEGIRRSSNTGRRRYFGDPVEATETQVLLSARYYFK